MSDTKQSTEEHEARKLEGEAESKPTAVRIRLKDREYRRLCEAARERGCSTQELVERCVKKLLEA